MTPAAGPGVTHVAEPKPDSAVTIGGPRHLLLLDMRYGNCWPARGTCVCGEVIWREEAREPWEHTGRKPGEPLG